MHQGKEVAMLPELMIFDMDGLLFDTERMFMELRAGVLPKYGYEHRPEDYMKTVGVSGKNLRAILDSIYGPEYPKDAVTRDTRALQTEYIKQHGVPIKPGIPELLNWTKENEIPCCVASSSQRPYVEFFIETAGMKDYFSFLLCGDEVSLTKPDPEIFLRCCEHAKTEPSRALVLEDSENGVLAACSGNIPVICIPDLKQPSEETSAKTAAVLSSADQVIPWIRDHYPSIF